MKLSSRTRYGARALLDLALHRDEEPVSLRDISVRQQVPRHYLEQLMSRLIAAELVRSTRGPRGGVSLVRQPEEITMGEVVRVFEGSSMIVDCDESVPDVPCVTQDFWCELSSVMQGWLESTTLQHLADRHKEKYPAGESMYYI